MASEGGEGKIQRVALFLGVPSQEVRDSVVLDSSFPPNWLSHSRAHSPGQERVMEQSEFCLPTYTMASSRKQQEEAGSPPPPPLRELGQVKG